MKSVSSNANASLFVDDFAVYIEGKHLKHLERTMQLCINKIYKWVVENGFKFSVSKTTCVHFHRQRIHAEPSLHLDGQAIPVKGEAKFLGVIFDTKLSFKPHIFNLKKKCQKALNLLRVVGHSDWGADKITLLKLYRTLVRSKLDYGSIVYGSAKKHILKNLDPIHHQGLRIALGAFRTSPVQSLYAEAGEPSLENRRMKLSMNYFLKIKSLPDNPCFDSITNSSSPEFFERSKTEPPCGTRTLPHILKSEIDPKLIDNHRDQPPPPWEQFNITFDHSLSKLKKDVTNEIIYKSEFSQLRERYSSYIEAYTDGSKCEQKVAAAAFYPNSPDDSETVRLRDGSSVFNAELEGILLALKYFKRKTTKYKKCVIYTDSLSSLQSLQGKNFKTKNTIRFYNLLRRLPPQAHIAIVWIPSHVGIHGNESADKLAKSALLREVAPQKLIIWSDLKPKVKTYIDSVWQETWNDETTNKLHEILPNLKENLNDGVDNRNRKQETVMSRLRIGHTWLTHNYLLKREDQPMCHACDSLYTVKHVLVECSDFLQTRNRFYRTTDMFTLFREVNASRIIGYLKELGVYSKI